MCKFQSVLFHAVNTMIDCDQPNWGAIDPGQAGVYKTNTVSFECFTERLLEYPSTSIRTQPPVRCKTQPPGPSARTPKLSSSVDTKPYYHRRCSGKIPPSSLRANMAGMVPMPLVAPFACRALGVQPAARLATPAGRAGVGSCDREPPAPSRSGAARRAPA